LGPRLIWVLTALVGVASAQTCVFTLSSKPQSFPLAGGAGVVNVTASASSCVRDAAATVSWITIDFGQHGTGDGSIGFTVAANSTVPTRTGAITVGSQSITITQAGPPCNFAINPNSTNISSAALNGTVALTGLSGCTWTATSTAPWLQLTSPASGMGTATIAYSVQANTVTTSRSGTISVAGLTFTVNQAGVCAYALSPSSGSYPSSGGNGMFAVSSNSGCAWTASTSSLWIRITSGKSGSGAGPVAFAVDPNTGDVRTGTIALADQIFTVAQASQSCMYTLSTGAASVPAAGGTATFSVAAPTICAWMPAASASWITIVTASSASGNGVVGISAPWNTGDARTGAITLGDQIFTVMQPSGMIRADGVANSASSITGSVSPGMIVTVAAPTGIGPTDTVTKQLTADGMFVTTLLGGTRVLFDGLAAPMLYAANGQFSAVVPYEVDGKDNTQMQVEYQGTLSNTVSLPAVPSAPGLFTLDSSGSGPGLIFDAQGNPNSDANPAAAESAVTLYVTGEGQTAPPGVDGLIAVDPAPAPVLPVTVTIDGINAPVLFYGGAVSQVAGMMRIDVQIPDGVMSGARPVVVQIGQAQSQTNVTVAIQ
jgi:uncharacterized protein (TIGR03437 family)